jgi:hypothetical protein
MARPTKPKPLYKNRITGYIYRIAHRTMIQIESNATPEPPAFALYTLRFQGRHPEDENTILVGEHDLRDNFTRYEPIQSDRPEAHKPNEETV